MDDIFENIKNNAPAFQTVFPYIEQIVKTDKPTEPLFATAINALAAEISQDILDEKIRTFLALPAKTHFCSNFLRRSFLQSVLLVALDQAIDPEKGNNGFPLSIQNSVLEKQGFSFKTVKEINDFGQQIMLLVPRLTISAFGKGTRDDETYFAVYYNYGKLG